MGQNRTNMWLPWTHNNLSVHPHKLIMRWPLSLASLGSEPASNWLKQTSCLEPAVWDSFSYHLTLVESRFVHDFQVSALYVLPSKRPVTSWALCIILVTGSLILGYQSVLNLSGIIRSFSRNVEENMRSWLLYSMTSEIQTDWAKDHRCSSSGNCQLRL